MGSQETQEQICINTIRFLAADAIEKAKSGHPGMPMGVAPAAFTLWTRHLKHDPSDPLWPDRDRFVLSAGHASMLLYALLYLSGYDVTLDDIQSFRQWGSKTPGHPERQHPPGTEMTTGPLGQGLAAAVGMAIAEVHLAARFNRPGYLLVDHRTYVFASDGDLMEGLSAEACALAGHLGLGKLVVLYDDNRVSLAGATALCFTEDITKRFQAVNWQVITVEDGNDTEMVAQALGEAIKENQKPSLIRLRTTIGFGAPKKQNTASAHGSPLGADELRASKENLNWPLDPPFFIPKEALDYFREAALETAKRHGQWNELLRQYAGAWPEEAAEFDRMMKGDLPADWTDFLPFYNADAKDIATRKASEAFLQAAAERIPELVGGSADLNPSTFSWLKGKGDFEKERPPVSKAEVDAHQTEALDAVTEGACGGVWGYGGRNIHFGVREHAMAAIAGGMALHGGIIPYAATFFTFADYMRPSIRLAALMGLRVIYIFTHDSIGVGEDGPTHQPIEHLMSLRAMPNLTVIRPADANETIEAWRTALENVKGPTALVLTRQNLPVADRLLVGAADGVRSGGYVFWDSNEGETPEIILIGTGSELQLAYEAGKILSAEKIRVRVVSLPSWELFDAQALEYRNSVIPPHVRKRVAVEAGTRLGWEHYVGLEGAVVGIDHFGASAPYQVLYEKFGVTAGKIVEEAMRLLGRGVEQAKQKTPPERMATRMSFRTEALREQEAKIREKLAKEKVVERIVNQDYTLWKQSPNEITNRLGWLQSPQAMLGNIDEIAEVVHDVKADGYDFALLLGMGGSSLAPEVLRKILGVKEGYLNLETLDSTDPTAIMSYLACLDLRKTLFVVSTKSGGTIETISLMKYFYNVVAETLKNEETGKHFLAITDPGSALEGIAREYAFRHVFLNDPEIGGRYSALSYFGMVPAMLVGIDAKDLLERALTEVEAECSGNPTAAVFGTLLGELAGEGKDKLTLIFSQRIAPLGDWIEQLIAESTGKEGKGILPVVGEPLGPPETYGDDRVFCSIRLTKSAEWEVQLRALVAAGHPVVDLTFADVYDLGAHFFFWEMATAVAGWRMGINPFDQPNVEASKALSRNIIARYHQDKTVFDDVGALKGDGFSIYGLDTVADPDDILWEFLSQAPEGSYAAFMVYLAPTPWINEELQRLRQAALSRFRLATTAGYGPRFLHSTGQLHKGDAGRGFFIQFTAEDREDLNIPDAMGETETSLTFGLLKKAQAYGDREALIQAGRRAVRIHFYGDPAKGIARLTDALEKNH